MKKTSAGVLLVIVLLLNYTNAYSQGIKVDFLGYTGIADWYGTQMFYGFGYDHNLGEKLSVGLTYKNGYTLDDNSSSVQVDYGFPSSDGDVLFSVYHTNEWHEFAFTSKYFFTDNLDGSYFVSSGISLVKVKNGYNIPSIDVENLGTVSVYQDLRTGYNEQDITLIPFSLDLGHRGDFDGLYYEIYTGIAFTPFGAHPDVEPAFLANQGVETSFSPISFHVGMSFGFGWAD